MSQHHAPLDGQSDPAASRDLLHDRRALALIGAGVVAVAAIGLFVVKPLLSSSSSSSTGVVANAHHHTATATVSPSVTPKPAPIATAAPALDVRDPFSPLFTPPAPTSSATAASPSPSAAASTQVQTVVVQEPGPTVIARAKYTLVLNSLSYVSPTASSVTVTLNGKKYTVLEGEAFPDATNGPFGLAGVDQHGIATFAYGDNEFTLHKGETQYEN